MMSIFSCAFWPSLLLLWRNVYLSLLFFNLIYTHTHTHTHTAALDVCIFWKLTTCWLLHLQKNFSHSMCCLSISFMISFAVQKLLSLIGSHLLIFVFIFIILGGGPKNVLLQFMSKLLYLCFSLGFI